MPGVSADNTVYKVESFSGRSFFGDTIPFNYKYNDTLYSGSLTYAGDISGTYRGSNIDSNSIMDSQVTVNSYDCIMYKASTNAGQFGLVHDVVVDCPVYFSDYARGGFGMTSPASTSTVTDSANSRILWPDNYIGEFEGISANTQASSALADFYAVINSDQWQGYSWNWRPLLYEIDGGGFLEEAHFDNVMCDYYGQLYFCIWLPYVGGDMTDRPPQTMTTASTSADWANVESGISQMNSGINDLNSGIDDLNSGVDEVHSDIVSGVSGIVSALVVPSDSLGDLVLDPIDTLPQEYDYDDIIDTAAEVIEDIPPGIVGAASLWGMLDMLFGVDSTFIWLIPLAVFMAIAAWVLYRTG